MSDPLFSVILPTCNRPASLLACLTGLRTLEYEPENYEVLVVNDGGPLPPDAQLARAAGGLSLRVVNQHHGGPAVARNTGATLARGEYLAFIDDDCVPDPNWLAVLGARMDEDPGSLVGGRTVNALDNVVWSDASQLLVDFVTSYHDASTPGRTRFFATSNMAVPAADFRRLGGFDAQFTYAGGEDRDFCDRWHLGGGRSVFEPAAVVYHRHRLDLRGFLAQHFRYGRGALRFRRAKSARDGQWSPAPARFYLALVRSPLRRRRSLAAAARAALLAAAQVATAAGYCWERARAGRPESGG